MELQQNDVVVNGRDEHEEALLALILHRTREVKSLRYYISYYTSQLEEAEARLQESKAKLAHFKGTSASLLDVETKSLKIEHGPKGAIHKNEGSSNNYHNTTYKSREVSSDMENVEVKERGIKRKFGQKEHKELAALVCKSSSPGSVNYQASNHFSSLHKRKLRCIALCPVNDQRFVTSALDGVVNMWEVQSSGSGASLRRTIDCVSPKQRRWPEDIAWHPEGNRLFSVYTGDNQDSQISVTDLSKEQGGGRAHINFLEDKPHVKGVINSIVFLPWGNTSFVTGGTDHAVILWSENGENKWKPKSLHRNFHTSAVMGVAGMQQKQLVLSAGKDKRVLGYDAHVGRQNFMHLVESKCLSVLPNSCDFNLFMVQTGTPERQLRLFDIRSKGTELHAFGWKQESSESQSALINQAWSPNGLYITSGSADPMIHIFDIRYNSRKPCQSIEAHQKRVFRAMWLQSVPLLISISSDLNIGLHKVV
ncbi:U5 small nuclear ribonucleoprotein 40 kDa protein-like [Abrus precatorius]|uniref:U5 small nuclear ribonucleoprotein 40 kDa protein-like n=1 Tax=Abrus precatorius TaxID=3816 RepID=A0A8B8KH56_ABRPR|nr:U5 small nuclear ribonucleoprotein 40 kDa protein-like [Abrus precatorius]